MIVMMMVGMMWEVMTGTSTFILKRVCILATHMFFAVD